MTPARSFDVISTNTGGVEVVIVPIHHGTLLLQFKGKAIYVDPSGEADYGGLPRADFIFFTAGAKGSYESLKKDSTVVVSAPEKKTFGELEVEPAGGGYLFAMAGRRFYVSGAAKPVAVPGVDAAFVCMSQACAKDPAQAVATVGARIVFPYRYDKRNLRALKSDGHTEVRFRNWY